jgi:hypothetical protein
MPDAPAPAPPAPRPLAQPPEQRGLYLTITSVIQALLVVGLVLFALRRNWENVFLTSIVIVYTLVPAFLFRRYRVIIPPEF